MARLQLVLAYTATTIHKLLGSDWTDGNAISILSGDPTFHFDIFGNNPFIAEISTYGALVFQMAFPVFVFIPKLRIWVLGVGVVFHLTTGFLIEIPDMALAFIASYAIWLPENYVQKITGARRLFMLAPSRT